MRALLAAAIASTLIAPQTPPAAKPERFSATMTAGPLNPGPVGIEIGVEKWSTPDERASLFDLFSSKDLQPFLTALKKMGTAGYVRVPNRERLQAAYAQQEDRPDGGRRVLLLCVRYRGDWETTDGVGWTDHPFRMVALSLDSRGVGNGMIFHTVKIRFSPAGPDLVSDLSGQPTRLLSVRLLR